jgi:repressor LexA
MSTTCLMCKGAGRIESPPPTESLTRAQRDVLKVVSKLIASHGYPPSIREICEETGLSSTSTVQTHLCTLRAKRYIIYRGVRQIVVLHGPDHSHPKEGETSGEI